MTSTPSVGESSGRAERIVATARSGAPLWVRDRLDLRLLAPALLAWAAVAVTLAWSVASRVLLAGGAGLVAGALVSGWVGRGRILRSRGPVVTVGALALLAIALGVGASGLHAATVRAGPIADLAADRAVASLTGTVASEPRQVTSGEERRTIVLVTVRVDTITARGHVTAVDTPVLLRGDERLLGLLWQERVVVSARLGVADPGRPEVAVARVMSTPRVVATQGGVVAVAEVVRDGLRGAVADLPPDARGLVPGLVIGDTDATPDALVDAMRTTSLSHLVAVSGTNVAIVLALVLGVVRTVGAPRRSWMPIGLAAVAGFVVLARPDPSVIRAAVMGSIGLIGMSRSRRGVGPPALAGAIMILLVIDPWLSRSAGFALSSLATLGILLFVWPWGDAIARHLPGRLSWFGPVIAIPVAAQLMCAPVIAVLQGAVSIVGVLANLAAAPLVPATTIAGVTTAVVAPFWPWAASWLAWCAGWPALVIAMIARTGADLPGATIPWPDSGGGAFLLAGVTLLGILTGPWIGRHVRCHPLIAAVTTILVIAATVPTRTFTWPDPGWRIVVCDVGQGDAIVVRSGADRAVLVDTGPEARLLDGCLDRLEIAHLDAVVLTHFHADHVAGLAGIGSRDVGVVITTTEEDPPGEAASVHRWARARGVAERTVRAGDRLRFGEVSAHVWWPARRITTGSIANNASVVLAVSSGPVDALLLADVEREAAHAMLLRLRRDPVMAAAATRFDAIKVAHHGSGNLDPDLLEAVAAPVALISVGEDNDHGHPTAFTLTVYRRLGHAVERTDRSGDIGLVDADGAVAVSTRGR